MAWTPQEKERLFNKLDRIQAALSNQCPPSSSTAPPSSSNVPASSSNAGM